MLILKIFFCFVAAGYRAGSVPRNTGDIMHIQVWLQRKHVHQCAKPYIFEILFLLKQQPFLNCVEFTQFFT